MSLKDGYVDEDEIGMMDRDGEMEDDEMVMMMPPDEVLDQWEEDEYPRQILANFQDPELEGQQIMKFRDVYRLLETLGMDRMDFASMFLEDVEEFDDDLDGDFDDSDLENEAMGGPPPRAKATPSRKQAAF